MAAPGPVQTIQATGKMPKILQLVGVVMVCASVVACVGGERGASSLLLMLGIAAYATGRFSAWWRHG